MNYSRREESFRYTFHQPLPGTFHMTRIDGEVMISSEGKLQILDMSLNGMKMASSLNIPAGRHEVHLAVSCQIASELLELEGTILWQESYAGEYLYGVQFQQDEKVREQLLQELKRYARDLAGMD
ncbi:PilZ domain-containing protein [Marinicrinis lubricantis]|uniref:PilZ domain-containing protein n=1 Tax=Marinicrinis lubricantis TaxID=2086470 RepID=A0ABW1IM38_9BACL